jgi:hypothetical protein
MAAGCSVGALATPRPEPSLSVDPLPGSFHLALDPQPAPYAVQLRLDDADGPSARSAEFGAGEDVAIVWSSLPFPTEKWIEVNGHDCAGTFSLKERFETDLVLDLTETGCAITFLGSHPEGAVRHGDVVVE